MSFQDSILGLFNKGSKQANLIMSNIRLPRVLAALLVGFGMGISGLIMQTNLNNDLAEPSTLGVSNASVLGANIAIIILSGGIVSTQNGTTFESSNPYIVSLLAFLFALGSIFIMLILSKTKHFSPTSIILIGIALSAVFQAITTIIQYFAVDVRLTSAVFWAFGDLERGTMEHNYIILSVVTVSFLVFMLFAQKYNVMQTGEEISKTLGINTSRLRFISLMLASLITATSISIFGIIGFIGIMAPHICRRIVGNNHKFLIPVSGLMGSIILQISDMLSRIALDGFSLPVGAITALLGAPFFLYIVFRKDRRKI